MISLRPICLKCNILTYYRDTRNYSVNCLNFDYLCATLGWRKCQLPIFALIYNTSDNAFCNLIIFDSEVHKSFLYLFVFILFNLFNQSFESILIHFQYMQAHSNQIDFLIQITCKLSSCVIFEIIDAHKFYLYSPHLPEKI